MGQSFPFQESQRFPDLWILMAIGVTAVPLALLGPFSVVGWFVSGLVGLFLYSIQLRTEVRADGIYVKLWPLHQSYRHIPWSAIERCEPIEYNSLARFGGWGLRIKPKEIAYNVGGNQGVLIKRVGQQSIVIGSRVPDEFASSVESYIGTR